jgi:hypothetical protein
LTNPYIKLTTTTKKKSREKTQIQKLEVKRGLLEHIQMKFRGKLESIWKTYITINRKI